MKAKVKVIGYNFINGYKGGDTGVVDGYCCNKNDEIYAIVILDKNQRFTSVPLDQLKFISYERT